MWKSERLQGIARHMLLWAQLGPHILALVLLIIWYLEEEGSEDFGKVYEVVIGAFLRWAERYIGWLQSQT